jgi:hypothetical protein
MLASRKENRKHSEIRTVYNPHKSIQHNSHLWPLFTAYNYNIPAATFHASYRGYMLGMGDAGKEDVLRNKKQISQKLLFLSITLDFVPPPLVRRYNGNVLPG